MFHGGKFRRGAAVLLAAVLTAGLAAGCGDKPAVSSGSSQSAGLSVKTVDLKQRKIRIYQYGFRKASITDTEDGRRLMNKPSTASSSCPRTTTIPPSGTPPWRDSPASTS